MAQSLRRSCATCARSKHSCDLRTPRCTRCTKRNIKCSYANEPLTAPPETNRREDRKSIELSEGSGSLASYSFGSLDPFDSYPRTRLPRERVQRLIYTFLHKIAFEYYPLDLNATSNPFLISWWPLALGDPALFHVSLQTACLDEELLAQKGFQTSELLMVDSVALLRRRVEDTSLAVQDGTINSVITLATIEFGKGNLKASQMHVGGVKILVNMRGGINAVRQTSPLTARMVSWVSMLIIGQPQFETQDDAGIGDGIPPIPEWRLNPNDIHDDSYNFDNINVDGAVRNVFTRLSNVFHHAQRIPLSTTRLHDLTCFVIHRLLLSNSEMTIPSPSPLTECIRYAIILYMFIIQGPTYYSHTFMLNAMITQLLKSLKELYSEIHVYDLLDVWFLAVGMVAASPDIVDYQWFVERAGTVASCLKLSDWGDVLKCIKSVLWLEIPQGGEVFRLHWHAIIYAANQLEPPESDIRVSSSSGTKESI